MQQLSITYEAKRPNASIPWSVEYIEKTKDPALAGIRKEYFKHRMETNGKHGWKIVYAHSDDPLVFIMHHYFDHATLESIDHQGFLCNLKFGHQWQNFIEWRNKYNLQHGITVRKLDIHDTKNAILDPKLEEMVIYRSQQTGQTPGFLTRSLHNP
jgi:hypothetical protein